MENVPSAAVCVATLAFFTATVAPATGPVALFTTPLTCFCALAKKANNSKIIDRVKYLAGMARSRSFLFIIQAVFKILLEGYSNFRKKKRNCKIFVNFFFNSQTLVCNFLQKN